MASNQTQHVHCHIAAEACLFHALKKMIPRALAMISCQLLTFENTYFVLLTLKALYGKQGLGTVIC